LLCCAAAPLAGCDQLREVEAARDLARCPLPCPDSCPASCLPSGYCTEVTLTAGELGLSPLSAGQSWSVRAAGFPPGAWVEYQLHWGLDIVERAGKVPFYPWIAVEETHYTAHGSLNIQAAYDSFPVWQTSPSFSTPANPEGTARLDLRLSNCAGPVDGDRTTCSVDPASTLTFKLTNSAPWLEAPPCP
jgi:hypothetical protein